MYYYNDMPFNSEAEALQAFGSIKMYFRDKDCLGSPDKRLRGYVLLSADISKLSTITNAIEGSRALVTDTGKEYILSNGQWSEWTGGGSAIRWSHF